jgi:hypothetical protein
MRKYDLSLSSPISTIYYNWFPQASEQIVENSTQILATIIETIVKS